MKFATARAAAVLSLGAAALGAQAPVAPASSADTIARDRRIEIAARLDTTVRRYFAHWEAVPRLDYDSLARAYRTAAAGAVDRRAFDLATMEFLAALHNAHTDLYDRWLALRDGAPLGFVPRWIGGRWVVVASAVDSVRIGDAVAAIDGEPFEAFFQRQRRYVASSSERAQRRAFPARAYLFPQRFTLTLEDGRTVAVERRAAPPAAAATVASASADTVAHRWLVADSVAYVAVSRFDRPGFERSALAALRDVARAPALVLDVRGNDGGSTPWRLQKALAGPRHATWVTGPDHVRPSRLTRMMIPVANQLARAPRFRGRIVVLANAGCASACEDLLVALKGAPRITIVGDTTYGSTGQPYFLQLGDGMRARVGARRVRLPGGGAFEGVGIAPDVYVAPTVDDLVARRDPAMARALAIARGS